MIRDVCKQRFQPVVDIVNGLLGGNRDCIIVAIDGMSASGKSTLGFYLKELFDCNLFHMDDFFLQTHQRTEKRLAEVGGNVDYERFQEEVLEPILKKETVIYRPFHCNVMEIRGEIEMPFKRLNIIEGSYSLHPYFRGIHTLRVFTEISEELQIERIRNRNGEKMLNRFLNEWIPKENAYFETFRTKQLSDLVI